MKRAPKIEILENKDGTPMGLVLQADFTAEHECGIKHLQQTFGCPIIIDDQVQGVDARSMTTPFNTLENSFFQEIHTVFENHLYNNDAFQKRLPKRQTKVMLLGAFRSGIYADQDPKKRMENILSLPGPRNQETTDFTAAWADSSFLIAGWTNKAHEILNFLADGIRTTDFALWLGGAGNNPFARSGFILTRPSVIPEYAKEVMLKSDRDRIELLAMAEATGIQKKIDAKNSASLSHPMMILRQPNGYFALSPRRIFENEKTKTKYPVMFWLNPINQDKNNYGSFTVEELELWLENKGPIPKQAKVS